MIKNVTQHQQQHSQQQDSSSSTCSTEVEKKVIETYTSYQRQILRQRCKPSIAQLAQWRTNLNNNNVNNELVAQEEEDDDDDDENNGGDGAMARRQPHTHAMTVILGQGSSLIHPLIVWKQSVSDNEPSSPVATMCQSAITVLDEQSQSLTKTISDWFHIDRNINDWMSKTVDTGSDQQQQGNNTTNKQQQLDLGKLDRLVEEISFTCQILARYDLLIGDGGGNDNNNDSTTPSNNNKKIISNELLPEWTWKYATLERFLSMEQWKYAKLMAKPVEIVVGTNIRVPSVVEDAQYLSSRAIERSSSTLSMQAMGTVAHSISHDIWNSTEDIDGGVYDALINSIGCWIDYNEEEKEKVKKKKSDNMTQHHHQQQNAPASGDGFAAALLDAIDDDHNSKVQKPNSGNAAPPLSGGLSSSGGLGIISSLTSSLSSGATAGGGGQQLTKLQQMRLDMQLCNLNGIHSASVACMSLVNIISSHLDDDDDDDEGDYANNNDTAAAATENTDNNESSKVKTTKKTTTSMIELAKEELERYSKSYENLLLHQAGEIIVEWCGLIDTDPASSTIKQQQQRSSSNMLCLHSLRDFFTREDYGLDSASFKLKSSDDRLEIDMTSTIRNSPIMRHIDKCDEQVTATMCLKFASFISTILLQQTIYYQPEEGRGGGGGGESSSSNNKKRPFTGWGSMLFEKEVRLIRNFIRSIVESNNNETSHDIVSSISKEFGKIDDVLLILQLDKGKSEFEAYGYHQNDTWSLSPEENDLALSLRIDYKI